ncbi:hypothetical protein ACHAWO_013133 [Cyclotella atomus]|uniref:Glycosyltransferase 61 catalytic domain-containing protein n=1 Tax=Cyclotella atomus TaxID=382360 RepID=A0ABD3PCC6_9STRA
METNQRPLARLSFTTKKNVATIAIIVLFICLQQTKIPLTVGITYSQLNNDNSSNLNNDKIHRLKSKANAILRESETKALPPQSKEPNAIHYKASRFQLAPGHSTSFNFSIVHTTSGATLHPSQYHNLTNATTIVCSTALKVLPHFAQTALPCWSVLRLFPNAYRFLDINNRRDLVVPYSWYHGLLLAFERVGVHILDNDLKSNETFKPPEWRVVMDPIPSGWQEKNMNMDDNNKDAVSTFEQGNPFYFLDQMDMSTLQQAVLGDEYFQYSYRDGEKRRPSLPLRILLIERRGYSRHWLFANQTADALKSAFGLHENNNNDIDGSNNNNNNIIEIKILPNPEGSLQDQAIEFHKADIILSPHGAQLTNLAFIKPCTVVFEFFPIQYYLAFFQPYVLSGHGISYDGYPFMREPLYDSKDTGNVGAGVRGALRGGPILASPESVVRAFPRLLLDHLSCIESFR